MTIVKWATVFFCGEVLETVWKKRIAFLDEFLSTSSIVFIVSCREISINSGKSDWKIYKKCTPYYICYILIKYSDSFLVSRIINSSLLQLKNGQWIGVQLSLENSEDKPYVISYSENPYVTLDRFKDNATLIIQDDIFSYGFIVENATTSLHKIVKQRGSRKDYLPYWTIQHFKSAYKPDVIPNVTIEEVKDG